MVGIVQRDARRGLWCPRLGYLDDEGLGHVLAARIVRIQCPAHFLLRPQDAIL